MVLGVIWMGEKTMASEKKPPAETQNESSRIPLDEVLRELRNALKAADQRSKSEGERPLLAVAEAEVEIKFTVGRSVETGGAAKFMLWAVNGEASAKANLSREMVNTIRVKFHPLLEGYKANVARILSGLPDNSKKAPHDVSDEAGANYIETVLGTSFLAQLIKDGVIPAGITLDPAKAGFPGDTSGFGAGTINVSSPGAGPAGAANLGAGAFSSKTPPGKIGGGKL
jgi:hypothetical protein